MTATQCSGFVAFSFTAIGQGPDMRIRRIHDREHEPAEPAWAAGKPVWSVVRIEAPKASDLVHPDDDHAPHAAA
jgi:hypothetical protein